MSGTYSTRKGKGAKTFELIKEGEEGYLAKIKDEEVANRIVELLNATESAPEPELPKEEEVPQIIEQNVVLSDEASEQIIELLDHYESKGHHFANRSELIESVIKSVHYMTFHPYHIVNP